MNVILREATKEDAANLLKYIDSVSSESDFLTLEKGEFKLTLEEEICLIEKSQNDPLSLFLIAEINGQVVGSLNFSSGGRRRTKHFGKFGVSVLRDYWGRGIGNELLTYLICWAQKNKVTRKINLEVHEDNVNAIHLYEKLGFEVEGRIARFFNQNDIFYDAIIMGMKID